MACLFMDGFDYYSISQMSRKWDYVQTTTDLTIDSTGALHGKNLRSTSNGQFLFNKNVPNLATIIIGFRIKLTLFTNGNHHYIFKLIENITDQIQLYKTVSNTFQFLRNGTNLGTLSSGFTIDTWHHFKCKITINNTTGSILAYIDDNEVFNQTNINTRASANNYCDIFQFGTSGLNQIGFHLQDLFIFNTSGSYNNDIPNGQPKIKTIYPDGNGNYSQLDGSDGNSTDNYLLVDEGTIDDDTTYVETDVATERDSYTYGASDALTDEVLAVAINSVDKITEAGSKSVNTFVRISSTNYDQTSYSPGTSYSNHQDILDTDPSDSLPWDKTGVDAIEAGYEVVS